MAANDDKFREEPKVLTARDRTEALLMAELNEDRATLHLGEPGLQAFLKRNAALFRRLAS